MVWGMGMGVLEGDEVMVLGMGVLKGGRRSTNRWKVRESRW